MKKLLALSTIGLLFTASCNKTAGEGGTSTIKGKVYVIDKNGSGETVSEFYGMDYDVYIIYGDEDQTYDEDFSTSLDGSYAFKHLTEGTYTVFAYSQCDECPGGMEVVSQSVEITDKKQTIVLDDIVIVD